MPLNIGESAPPITGTDVVSGQPWALQDHDGKAVLLAFSGITWCGPCMVEAPALQNVWTELSSGTSPPFTMAIISGMFGAEEVPSQLQSAIANFGITFPVVPGDAFWPTYLITSVPTLYCLLPEGSGHTVAALHQGASGTTQQITNELLDFLYGCGINKLATKVEHFLGPTFLQLFGGVTSDGGGWGITPGGKPVPIPPWDPLRPLGRAGHDAMAGLAVAAMGAELHDPALRQRIREAGIEVARASLARLEEASEVEEDGVTVGGPVAGPELAHAGEGKGRR